MKKKIKSKDLGLRNLVLSYEDAQALKLLISAKLAELYYADWHNFPYNDKYFNQLVSLNEQLDNMVYSFVEDLPF